MSKAGRKLKKIAGQARPKGERTKVLSGGFDGSTVRGRKPGYILARQRRPDGSYSLVEVESSTWPQWGTPLLVEEDPLSSPRRRKVVAVDVASLIYNGVSPDIDPGVFSLPLHAFTHEANGRDELDLHVRQIGPHLRVRPGTTSKHVFVDGGVYIARGELCVLSATVDVDLTANYPTTGAKFVWICASPTGVYVLDTSATTWEDLSFPPSVGFGDYIAAIVAIYAGKNIAKDDVVHDLRWMGYGNSTRAWGYALDNSNPLDGQVQMYNATAGQYILSSVSGGGVGSVTTVMPSFNWVVDGPIAVADNVDGVRYVEQTLLLSSVWLYCETLGTASSTIADIDVSTDGVNWDSVFPAAGDRPELLFNDADKQAVGVPSSETFIQAGSLLRCNIEQVADGARMMTVQLSGTTSGGYVGGDGELPTIGVE